MRVLVTGANGFLGSSVTNALREKGFGVRGAVRNTCAGSQVPCKCVSVGEVNGATDWSHALEGVSSVVHLVARTHVMNEHGKGNLQDYRPVNVEGTQRLAEQAAEARVQRMVFVSSVKVNGERTHGKPFAAEDVPEPEDAYGISKWEAEQVLAEVSARTALETVIVRPPLVYGPGVKGNFARLIALAQRSLPLPLGAIDNCRSLVALPNLVDLLVRCVEAPEASGRIFFVSDGEDVSTPQLVRLLGEASGRKTALVPVPPALLRMAGCLTGRSEQVERLCGSLQVDISATRELLAWQPPITLRQALHDTVTSIDSQHFSSL